MKGKIWADISLPEKIGQEVLSISYETKKNARLYVYAPMIGEFCFIFRQHLLGSFFSILMILGMTGLGLVSVIVFLYTRHRQIVEKKFLNVALFLILCSLWCIFDSGIYQMYGSQNAAGTLISFYAFMTMPVPMLLFVQNTVSESVRWIPQVWIFLLYANAVLQGFLYFLFRIPFIDMVFIIYGGCVYDSSFVERVSENAGEGSKSLSKGIWCIRDKRCNRTGTVLGIIHLLV